MLTPVWSISCTIALKCALGNYERIPDEVRDHHETEVEVLAGGYSYRQVLELVQNAADAILEDTVSNGGNMSGRIVLRLSGNRLYAANTGAPLSKEGVIALLSARSSSKRQNQIGRFGVGFKSLLGLEGPIDVYSRSVSLRFDPAKCAKKIRERLSLPVDQPAPGLRLAWSIEAESKFNVDPILADLSQWATTIVRVDIGQQRLVSYLNDELLEFPGEFLLFLPVDVDLELLSDSGVNRRLARKRTGSDVSLVENDEASPWQVVDTRLPLNDPEARADATTVHTRDEVPIAWALPLAAREEKAGRFWAFFPTDTLSRIPGYLNAPWKVNSDRTALIHGPYNTFLMESAAKLVVSALAPLATVENPARALDMFPRELDTREETARPLVDAIWEHLDTVRLVPDGAGELQAPSSLMLHPVENEESVKQWWQVAVPDVRAAFVHPDCYRGQRLNRLKFLLRRMKINVDEIILLEQWLERVASVDSAKARNVLHLVKCIHETSQDYNVRNQLRRSRLIPTEEGMLVAAPDAVISSGVVPSGKCAVHHSIATDKKCRKILKQVLGVRRLDDAQWQELLKQALQGAENARFHAKNDAWRWLWNNLRDAPQEIAVKFVASASERVRALSLSGEWELSTQLLRPGAIVINHSDLADVLVDEGFHADDQMLLESLQIRSEPRNELIDWINNIGDAYQEYRNIVRSRYAALLARKEKYPQWAYLDFVNDAKVLAGAPLLDTIPLSFRGNLTTLLLNRLEQKSLQYASFGHTTRQEVYEAVIVPSPTCWLIVHYGAIELAGHFVPVHDLIAAHDISWLQRLPGWDVALTKIDSLITGLVPDWEFPMGDLKVFWLAVLASCESNEVPQDLRRTCYEAAAAQGHVPSQVWVRQELLPINRCFVTSSDVLFGQAAKAGVPVVVLAADAIELWTENGAQNLARLARIEFDEITPQPLSLLDVVPEIAPALSEDIREIAWVQACQKLRMQIGEVRTPLPAALEDGAFLIDLDQLARRSWQDRLTILVHEAINAGWIVGDAEKVSRDIVQRNYVRRRTEVAANATLEERLLAAAGGNQDALLGTFDDAVRRAVALRRTMTPLDIARLTLAVHGPTVLTVLKGQLEEEGLEPPSRWGTQEAFEFAMALGFPPEFGGSRRARRPAEIWASGPMPLGELHDYQDRLVGELGNLIVHHHKEAPARAVLGLPTGSGKTRVAVETAVHCALRTGATVLWVAQTDELCEQAVQSFRQVWANLGQPWTELRLLRLWGGNPNPGASDIDVPTVVVASIQTVVSRVSGTLPEWIQEASLVVIDEAHHAIAPSYTRLLNWLTAKQADDGNTTLPPLLGLSATPFRGRNEEESHRLASRFGGRLYPASDEQGDLYQQLQAKGILSEIITEPLNYSQPFVLTDKEKKQVETFDEFPETAAQRMGEDEFRNEAIVHAVADYAAKSQVLLFANSVWHASHLAALLQLSGVEVAAVHGGTETSARQYFIRQFQNEKIKVLCNYGVLTTGFDAPKTEVIVISRPVFSPVRYMQMVGRGLRGEKNGGTATCTVVTVLDNIVEYSDRLAYHTYFTPYYQ